MSRNKDKIIEALEARGFTGNDREFQLFYWVKDGWYLHCDQMHHEWIGASAYSAIDNIKRGDWDSSLEIIN